MRRIRSLDRRLDAQAAAHLRAHQVLDSLGRLDLWDDAVSVGSLPHSPGSVRAFEVRPGWWWLFGWNDNDGDASRADRFIVAATAADGVRLFLIDRASLLVAPAASLRGPRLHIDVVLPDTRALGGPDDWSRL